MCWAPRTKIAVLFASLMVPSGLAFAPVQPFTRKTTFLSAEEVMGGTDALTEQISDTASSSPLSDTPLGEVADTVVKSAPSVLGPDGSLPPLTTTVPGLDTIALVAGQENYGLAVVCVAEAIWSFLQAPSLDHAKILAPATVAALILGLVSGPMVTSGDPASVSLGLEIATGVSVLLGASYVARLVAPFSPSPKEIVFLGLLVSIAGFFSFSQNLVVDGFITLPSLPSIELPSLPSIGLPSF